MLLALFNHGLRWPEREGSLEHVCKRFGERCILKNVNLSLSSTTRILLTGPNGSGKTTLFKLIQGEERPDQGTIRIVDGARIGYLAQEPTALAQDQTVIETYRHGQIGYEGELIGRLLGYGLFRLEDMEKQVRQLSIGQRRKLELACLLAARPNVLLLDEPTNYISLDLLEAFEAAILHFPGPVLVISHDRWFNQRYAGECWEINAGMLIQKS
ncbi:ATP-binding cassette domain-containing protein [Dictyobacter arantiisoli]|uniref:ABC transporter domain-containing protein n=1 Tax=Dictyobacter arantiisoli TaxID=2014874 RepID=A0A5A5TBJ6_9CHLR|nr:ATP-binding cassette domain-containing protein [Dictyobacter arantiisoli]GCF08802.1 hypothetical protein KDI_23660 [Dictyobacter arantiisoli]